MRNPYTALNAVQQNDGYEQPVNNRNNVLDGYEDVQGTMEGATGGTTVGVSHKMFLLRITEIKK